MSTGEEICVLLTQREGYTFTIDFRDGLPPLLSDEPPPLGAAQGPNPSRLLLAAIANCLAASLVFALRKFRNTPGPLRAEISARAERNDAGRWRIPRAVVRLTLAEDADAHTQLPRILEQFEQFCVVTQSVREGIEVSVELRDARGTLLHPAEG